MAKKKNIERYFKVTLEAFVILKSFVWHASLDTHFDTFEICSRETSMRISLIDATVST